MATTQYDVLIVGAGVAGSSLAHALSTLPRPKPLRIAVLERSLAEPDRIVGELLQPGGVAALGNLGLADCLDGIDAIPVHGYCVLDGPRSVHIPYPDAREGRSFHHGKFIQSLRAAARRAAGVQLIEATATALVESADAGRVVGVRATGKDGAAAEYRADLVVVADGCFSNFRSAVMGAAACPPATKSHFIGAVLEDVALPMAQHGTVALIKGFGPVLLYQIGTHDTRMLVDVKQPLPSDLKTHILTNILPQLPAALHLPIEAALAKDRLRRMPNSFLPSVEQGGPLTKAGVLLLGDAWNMRHPLTGGGMTVAFHDVVMLRDLICDLPDLGDWDAVRKLLHTWHWKRKPLSSTINILSVALYDLFGADDEELAVLRTGCFKYFELGGDCINGPVSLLSGITASPLLLARHFFAVAFYSIWLLFTHPQPRAVAGSPKPVYAVARVDEYPGLLLKSVRVFWTACVVFGPLLWSEIRWWAPREKGLVRPGVVGAVLVLLAAGVLYYRG